MAEQELRFLPRLMYYAKTLKSQLSNVTGTMAIPDDMPLKELIDQFADEFSKKSPGILPWQIGPQALMNYYQRFSDEMPGFANRNPAFIQSDYSREITELTLTLAKNVLSDLRNPTIQLSWWLELLGKVFVPQGDVRHTFERFVAEKVTGMAEALKAPKI